MSLLLGLSFYWQQTVYFADAQPCEAGLSIVRVRERIPHEADDLGVIGGGAHRLEIRDMVGPEDAVGEPDEGRRREDEVCHFERGGVAQGCSLNKRNMERQTER